MSTGLWPAESRQLLALLGALGAAETAFLSYQKLVVGDLTALCSLGGGGLSARCGDVLNSEYASFLGVPLTLPAMLAYGTVAFLAARPLLLPEGSRERAEADLASRDPLLVRFMYVNFWCTWVAADDGSDTPHATAAEHGHGDLQRLPHVAARHAAQGALPLLPRLRLAQL